MKKTILLALGLGLNCCGIDIDSPPTAGHLLPAWGAIKSPSDVERLFRSGQDTPKAIWSDRGFVILPVNFSEARHQRVTWDIKLDIDLRMAKGVQFDFFCRDPRPFSSFSLYFRSGKGWYHGEFTPERKGVWQRIIINKSDMQRTEGHVAGWGEVDTMRISGWRLRDEDTVCAIANLGFAGGKAEILVVRADSVAAKGGSEAKSFSHYAEAVSTTLDSLDMTSAQVSDLDLTPQILDGISLAVLPYNPSLPPEATAALKKFTAKGGRLLACYSLPQEISDLIGVNNAGSAVPDGGFSGFSRTTQGVRAQPNFAPQKSWRTTLAKTTEASQGRVAATWTDSQGADTGHPAITITEKGAFIGHVWMGGPDTATTALMRSLIGEMVPAFWRQTAEKALSNIGAVGGATSLDNLKEILSAAKPPLAARRELSKAASLRNRAQALYEVGEWDKCFAVSGQASDTALRAWMMTRKPQRDEHRAFWCHSAFGLRGKDWDASIRFLAENGFNVILPNMLWGGVAFYPSAVLPEYGELPEKGDQLAACLAACKKHGVKCHVWKVNWNTGHNAPDDFVQRMVAEGRVQRNSEAETSDRVWLCPSHPANQELEVESMLEIVRKYPVDGIHFDYIRYPGLTACHCQGCRQRFSEKTGREFKRWPDDLRGNDDGAVWQAWLDFRRASIDAVVRRVSTEARKIRPDIQVSAAVFRNWPIDRDTIGQDWKMWCEQGWLDFVCPMNYVDSNAVFLNMIATQKDFVGKARLYPGIGLSCWKDSRDPVKLAEQIEITREQGLGGFTVFNFDANAEAVLPFMRLGVTAETGWRSGMWPFK
ncbi:MAG: family 10 glycosylhydrolase [Kiritimatiellae bacterium]|nr:family 10 glycosylhydrolase [Kiritimatiellia bacterium]